MRLSASLFRTLLTVTAFVAGALLLWILGGWSVAASTVVIGVTVGACASFLFRRSKVGATPLIAATTVAVVSEVFGIHIVGFRVEDWQDPLGKAPIGLDDLFWYPFWGSVFGSGIGVAYSLARCACEHAGGEDPDAQEGRHTVDE
jgi:hypothetical protein